MRLFLVFTAISTSFVGPISAQSGPTAGAAVGTAPAPAVSISSPATAGYAAHRVYDTKRKRFVDFETMAVRLAKADIVFLGEQHDDPRTHQLQAATLDAISRRRTGPIVLALEMFERDVQGSLDAYLAGTRSEADFLSASRPWPNYAADYRPLVEYARAKGWPVVGGNVPRRLASVVARRGLAALDSLPATDRALVAKDLKCPRDAYWDRFKATMGDMSGHGMQLTPEQADQMVWRTYEAQCVKDETMGEAVAAAHLQRNALVIHANGSFHSDYGFGTAERVRWRAPNARITVVSFVPVADLDTVDGKARRKLGDYVVFTLETPKPAPATAPAR
jgi:uncharacterized iron-regulated protein